MTILDDMHLNGPDNKWVQKPGSWVDARWGPYTHTIVYGDLVSIQVNGQSRSLGWSETTHLLCAGLCPYFHEMVHTRKQREFANTSASVCTLMQVWNFMGLALELVVWPGFWFQGSTSPMWWAPHLDGNMYRISHVGRCNPSYLQLLFYWTWIYIN